MEAVGTDAGAESAGTGVVADPAASHDDGGGAGAETHRSDD
jgi:hypothetical protein